MQLRRVASLAALAALVACSDAASTDSAAQADAAQSVDASGGDLGAMDDTVSGTPGGGDAMEPIDDAASGAGTVDTSQAVDVQGASDTGVDEDTGPASNQDAMEVEDGVADSEALPDGDGPGGPADASPPELDAEDASPGALDVADGASGEPDADIEGAFGDTDAASVVDASPPEEDVELPPQAPLYLLSVNNATHTLEKIDVATGAGTDICQLSTAFQYPSLTFSRDNGLYASRSGNTLDAIDPCTCEVTPIGPYNGFTGVNGITSDQGQNLFGVSHVQDELITIDTTSGAGTSIGALGVDFGYTGATWSESEQTIYAIDATTDGLFVISPETGVATFVAPLSQPMGTVGIEMHPMNGLLYACSDPAHLLEIDITTGVVTDLGDMGQNTACNNLAAPYKPVPCLE